MRFVFRPLTPLAVYLRKRAWDIAKSMKGRVLNRIEDGFLLQAVAMDDAVTVTVVDLRGVIYIPVEAHAGADDWYAGFSLHFEGNPTDGLYVAPGPVFTAQAETHYVGPRRFATIGGGQPWGSGRVTGSGACFTAHETGVYSARVSAPSGATPVTCTIQRTRASSLFRPTPAALSSGALPADEVIATAGGVGLFELPVSVFDLGEYTIQNWLAVAPTDVANGYLVGIGRRNSNPSAAGLGYDRLVVVRYTLVDATEDNPVATVEAAKVAVFGSGDLPAADAAESLPVVGDVRPPGPGTWTIQSVDGPYDPDANLAYALQFSRPDGIDAEVQWIGVGYVLDRPKQFAWPDPVVIGCRGGVTMMVTAVTRLEVDRVPATLINSSTSATEAVDLVDRWGAEQRVSYIARVEPGGSKTLTRVEKSVVATHDPRWRGEPQVEHYPVHVDVIEDQAFFVCLRREVLAEVLEPVAPGSANYDRPTPITRPDNISLVSVDESGAQSPADIPGYYPVYFSVMDGRASEIPDWIAGGADARLNYGQRPTYNIFPGSPVEYSKPSPVCRYGQWLYAAVVAPSDAFVAEEQTARVAVVDIRTGELFAMSPPILSFQIEGVLRDGEVQRWHLSCAEEAVFDEDGALIRHAVLLALRTSRKEPSRLYRLDNLETLTEIGTTISTTGGPAYYLGTPIAPARVGVSTNRRYIVRPSDD
jgi:hypothetical protein